MGTNNFLTISSKWEYVLPPSRPTDNIAIHYPPCYTILKSYIILLEVSSYAQN